LGQTAIGCREVDIVVGQSSFLNHGARIDDNTSIAGIHSSSSVAFAVHDQCTSSGGNNGRTIDVNVRVIEEKLIAALDVGVGNQSGSDRRKEGTDTAGDESAGIEAVFRTPDGNSRGSANICSVGQIQIPQSDALGCA
jgi:hypothetical protein